MSGQLVGEMIAAADELRALGLTERGFHALLAIAEKAGTESRQASVRWDHIRNGLYGASLSTAKRAIADLKSAGIVRVVKRGFNNQQGRACAPVYEIEWVTQMTRSADEPMGHTDDPFVPDRTGQTEDRTGQTEDRTAHPGDLLDGSIDGSIDGESRVQAAGSDYGDRCGPYGPRCRLHWNNSDPPSCSGCKAARQADEVYRQRQAARVKQVVALVELCKKCDAYGRDDDLIDCPLHPNLRTMNQDRRHLQAVAG